MIPRHLLISVAVMLVIVLSMGLYLRHMRRSDVEMQRLAGDTRPVAPPASGPTETVTLYVADDAAGGLRTQAAQIPLPSGRQQRAEELLRELLRIYQQTDSPHPIAPAADLRSVYLIDPGAAVIDFNAAFADQHRSGVLTEQLTVNSLVQTLAVNVPGVTRVKILVDGATRETLAGHADLTEFLDTGAVNQAVAQEAQ
ncbi:MAG TPA: GerMN domain-containing protein [Terriglobales bacterium]|nr:GerMN domain-containing protein [Terriglobales bacterium]